MLFVIYLTGAFLIPYVIVTIIFAMPLFYLEVCLGQFSRQGPIGVWGLCPIMKGKGYNVTDNDIYENY